MAIEFSEVVWFVTNPLEAAAHYMETLGWQEIERFNESWILLSTPGGGKIGFMQHIAKQGEPWPPQMVAFKSDSIETDIAAVQSKGLKIDDATKGKDMWHTTYTDEFGNKILNWQETK